MKNIFRRKAGPNGNFVVVNSSFQGDEELPPPAQGEDGATDVSLPEEGEEDRTSVGSHRSKENALANNAAPILPLDSSWEASKSFQEDEGEKEEERSMVEVVTSEKGNSVILGDDEEIFMTDAAPPKSSSRFNKWFRRSPTMGTAVMSFGNFFGRKSSHSTTTERATTERAGWTPREKVLLWITAFNTILIIILLGSNAALVQNQKETKRSFAAATDGGCPVSGDGSTINATPPSEWQPPTAAKATKAPASSPVIIPSPVLVQNTTISVGDPNSNCGCAACTDTVWNTLAGEFTCGDRITYLTTSLAQQYPTEVQACRQVAFEFPCLCGGCDPSRCALPTPEFNVPSSWVPPVVDQFGNAATPAPTPVTAVIDPSISAEDMSLYCFPDASARTTFSLWGGMVIQPKASEGVCGPGNNFFRPDTVQVDTTADTLTLFYANAVASEVRVLLPAAQRPYTYGTYRFSVKSVEVLNAAGTVLSNTLPKELVLGLFTWDPLEVRDSCFLEGWTMMMILVVDADFLLATVSSSCPVLRRARKLQSRSRH
jgi:hypothetical protein